MITPPGGWRFTDPTTGFTSVGITFQQLVQRVAVLRQNNNITTVGSLSEEIEEAICNAMPPEDQAVWCDMGMRPPPQSVDWQQVQQFLNTAKEFVKEGAPLVTQDEAERRAAICVTCPYNVVMSGCATCRVAVAALRDHILKVSTSKDEQLQSCGVCGCDNRTQAHIPLEILKAGEPRPLRFPEWCWKAVANKSES